MKKYVIGLITGLILAGSIGVYATIRLQANEVEYSNGISVKDKIDDLYDLSSNNIEVSNLTKYTDGVKFEGDYYSIYTPNISIKWNNNDVPDYNYEKIIFCHKVAGNNANFEADLPFDIAGKTIEVKLISEVGNFGWNPRILNNSTSNHLNVDVNYGIPELSEYFFAVLIK